MDAIHRSKVESLFKSLDTGLHTEGPVIRDMKHGFRLDLSAVDDFFGSLPSKHVVEPERPAKAKTEEPKLKPVRLQFEVAPEAAEYIKRLAEAEGYMSYTDWLRGLVDRVLSVSSAPYYNKHGEVE